MKKIIVVFFCLVVALLSSSQYTYAQMQDPSKVNVSALSDAQIERIISEMQSRGVSENEAMALAKARGMSNQQIALLKRRIQEVKLGGGSSSSGTTNTQTKTVYNEASLSQKAAITDSTIVNSKIFGFSFFNNNKLSFEPNINAAVSDNYLLGVGDVIGVDVWGKSEQSYTLEIDVNGNVNIPEVGVLYLGSSTLREARSKIINKLKQIYSDLGSNNPGTFASITMQQIRAINVNVIGEAYVPGTYVVPGTASAFSALYLAGGPNEKGSFRDIKLIRGGDVVKHIDIYQYLIDGISQNNVALKDGDILLIEPYKKRVIVEGQFKRTGFFETKDEETVDDVIRFAGGFNENAYTKRMDLYRKDGREMEFVDAIESQYDSIIISNGDSLVAGSVLNRFKNMVTIKGAIFRPGNYELTDGLYLSTLIKKADGLSEDAFMERGSITRLGDDLSLQSISFSVTSVVNGVDDVELKKNDVITISSIHDLRDYRTIEIYGEVKHPGQYSFKEGMTLGDVIFEAGGFKEAASDAFIEVARRYTHEEMESVTNNIAQVFQKQIPRNLNLEAQDAQFELLPFDKVFIRKMPGFIAPSVVHLRGEVAYEGEYALTSTNEKISDIIKRSGGLTPEAYTEGAMLIRKVNKQSKVDQMRKEFLMRDSLLNVMDYGFEVVGISLDKILNNPGGKEDIFLQDGDEINIPKQSQVVKVSGEVLSPVSVTYNNSGSLRKYISKSGGFTIHAKKNKVYVVYANGLAKDTKSFLFFRKYPKVQPGSEIFVPLKPERTPMGVAGWIGIASSLASLSLTVIAVINAYRPASGE